MNGWDTITRPELAFFYFHKYILLPMYAVKYANLQNRVGIGVIRPGRTVRRAHPPISRKHGTESWPAKLQSSSSNGATTPADMARLPAAGAARCRRLAADTFNHSRQFQTRRRDYQSRAVGRRLDTSVCEPHTCVWQERRRKRTS